jgi:hypothetical protein
MGTAFVRSLIIGFCCIAGQAYGSDLTRAEAKQMLGFMGCNDANIAVLTNGAMPGGFLGGTGTGTAYVLAICDRDGKDVTEERTFIYDTDRGWIYYENKDDYVRTWTLKGYTEPRGPNWAKSVVERAKAGQAIQAFGLVGLWAPACTLSYRSEFAGPPSPVFLSYLTTKKDTPMIRAEIQSTIEVPQNRLEITYVYKIYNMTMPGSDASLLPVSGEVWKSLIEKDVDRIRTVSNHRLDGGKSFISGGIITQGPAKGQPVPYLEKCND